MIRLPLSSILILALVFPEIGYTQSEAWFGNELGSFYSRGDYYGAIKYIESKIKEYENNSTSVNLSIQQYNYLTLWASYIYSGLPNQALKILKQYESKFKDTGAQHRYFSALAENLKILRRDNELFSVLEEYKQFLDKEINSNPSMRFSLMVYYRILGYSYFEKHEYSKALIPLIEHSKLEDKIISGAPNSLTSKLRATNNPLIITLYKVGKQDEITPYLRTITDSAIYYQLNDDFEKSWKSYSRHLNEYSKLDSFWKMQIGVPESFYGLLCLMEKPDALQNISDWIVEQETLLKTSFISFSEKEKKDFLQKYTAQLNLYYSALLYFHDRGKHHSIELLEKSLQTKGLIMDITKQQKTLMREAMTDKVLAQHYEQTLKLRNKVAALNQAGNVSDSLIINSAKLSEMERKINESLSDKVSILPNISWTQIRQRLAPNESFVNIMRIERDNFKFDEKVVQYYAFIIKPNSEEPQMVKLGEGKDFENRLFKLYQNSIRNQLEDKKSYDNFWRQLAVNLKGINKVLLSADGIYNLISLPTLYNSETKKYLIDEIEVVRMGTGRDFISNNAEAKTSRSTISLIGNPNFMMKRNSGENLRSESVSSSYVLGSITNLDRAGLSPLPGTQKEIELIADRAKSSGLSVSLYNGSNATEKNVKKTISPSVLHLATHGQFDQYVKEDSYLQSKLILAGAGDEEPMTLADYEKFDDGLLTAFEVIQMNLDKTDLIVLSACETGLGEVQNGEGVWGLQRAFQLAGAKSIMGSLWKISDEATVTYMDAFYKSYLSGTSIPQSYQFAMKITKAKYPHPYYWGAFILNGN